MTVAVSPNCTACGACVVTCPTNALARSPLRPRVDPSACIDCLECVEVCPAAAIHPVEMVVRAGGAAA
ncbi:MAG TPA: 4Fe-4S binding protein [Acidimicrobiales bacterium]|nr:4Fe-4S binding protein [Acidimicrobiales bacterium]